MSILLDVEPVLVEETTEGIPCFIVNCSKDAEWEWLMKCSCAFHYCAEHDKHMYEEGPGAHVGLIFVIVAYACPEHGDTQLAMRTPL